jgi:membrane-associated protease RseP (regulator of RpoE activity)
MKRRVATIAALLMISQAAMAAPPQNLGTGTRVDEVDANGPAATAGIRPGDVIRAIGGVPINIYSDIDSAIAAGGNRALAVDIDRDGKHLRLKVKPQDSADSQHKVLGITHFEAVPAPKPRWNLVNAMFGEFGDHPRAEKAGEPGKPAEPEKEGPHDLYHIMFPDESQGAAQDAARQ